jgi:hypothetical protein
MITFNLEGTKPTKPTFTLMASEYQGFLVVGMMRWAEENYDQRDRAGTGEHGTFYRGEIGRTD